MGTVIRMRDLNTLDRKGLLKPLVFCSPTLEQTNHAVSLNIPLAEKLITVNPKRRTMRMEQCVKHVLEQFPDGVSIKDFDVMFNPKYEVDILLMFIALYKNKPFDIIWPGRYENGKLIYADSGYKDYRVYDIAQYDITCVI